MLQRSVCPDVFSCTSTVVLPPSSGTVLFYRMPAFCPIIDVEQIVGRWCFCCTIHVVGCLFQYSLFGQPSVHPHALIVLSLFSFRNIRYFSAFIFSLCVMSSFSRAVVLVCCVIVVAPSVIPCFLLLHIWSVLILHLPVLAWCVHVF